MTQEEKIKDLEERIALMDANDSALCADLEHYKKVAAGLKGRNKQLSERAAHYKQLVSEGDELNEKRIAEIEEKKKVIEGLQSQINNLIENKTKMVHALEEKEKLMEEYVDTIAELRTPWWRKIF